MKQKIKEIKMDWNDNKQKNIEEKSREGGEQTGRKTT